MAITKQEIIDWVNFLYKDLLYFHVFIGGFYFTFDQLNDFKQNLRVLESHSTHLNNKISINTQMIHNPLLKSHTAVLEKENAEMKKASDFITTKVSAINRHKEKIQLPVTLDEFTYIVNRLEYARDEVEHFHSFLIEEAGLLTAGDENAFFTFVQDLASETKKHLTEEPSITPQVITRVQERLNERSKT